MNELMNKETITSLELCKQINIFRAQEGRSELKHYTLMEVIKDEFEEEINDQICLDVKKATEMKYVKQYGEVKWENGYAVGQNDKEQELIPVIDGLQDKVKTQEKVINANLTTTQVVNILNRENDLGTKKLTTTMFFDYLAYCEYGERKPYGDSCYSRTKFYANEAMQDTLHKFGLGKVTITKTKYGEIHDFKFTRDFVDDITVEKLIEFMYRDENKDKLF